MQSEGLEARARRRYRATTMSDHEQADALPSHGETVASVMGAVFGGNK
jgi:hypothetical protein